jgi:hypothetical protein
MTNVMARIGVAALLGASVMAGGCQQKARTGAYNLEISPGSGVGRAEVDLVGVKSDALSTWQGVNVADHFSGNNALRQGAQQYTRTITLDGGKTTVAASDPIWAEWKGRNISHVFILAGGRGVSAKKELPVTTDKWNVSTISIIVKPGDIDVPTPMKDAVQK